MSLNNTPSAERLHIGIFGKRNAGKSSIINAITGQELAIVSEVKGTTTDPVYKAMELLPLGPVVMIDTPGLDDEGELGAMRVRKSYQVLNKTDIALVVADAADGVGAAETALIERIRKKGIPYLIVYNKSDVGAQPVMSENSISVSAKTGENIHALKERIGRLVPQGDSANSISTTVIQVLTVIIHGSANATGVMTGKWIGAGKIEELKRYAKRLQLVFLALGLVTGVTLYLVKDFILGFYAITPETKTMAVHFIIILCITTVGTGYQLNVLTGFVRGGGDTTFVLINDSIFMWLIVLPASALAAFVFHAPPEVVFLCLKSDQILKCFVALVKVNRWKWIRVLTQ